MLRLVTKRVLLGAALVLAGIGSGSISHVPDAHAYDVGGALQQVQTPSGYVTFYNFDFYRNPSTNSCASTSTSSSNADNPITILFSGNASDNTVSTFFQYAQGGYSNTYASGVDCDYWWDSGMDFYEQPSSFYKTQPGCNTQYPVVDKHIRYYPAMYDLQWGYFVLASTHLDENDTCVGNPSSQVYGFQEDAEHEIVNDINWSYNQCNKAPFYLSTGCISSVSSDAVDFFNQETWSQHQSSSPCDSSPTGYYINSTHCMQSDGYATRVVVN